MKVFKAENECDLKEFTGAVYPQGSFCLAVLLKNKDVKVNGVRVNKNVALKKGDEVTYYTSLKQEAVKSHEKLYEDENVLVADKLSGVETSALLCELNGYGQYFAVHRLDRNTQGVIVFAKNAEAERELLNAFKERRAEKIYLAICKDNFKSDEKVLKAYLKKDEKNSLVKIYPRKVDGSVEISTEYRVIGRADGLAKVRITLHSGKTHQIRAHMAYIGCPVLGDEKYGDSELNRLYKLKRQRLSAKSLQFDFNGVLSYLNGKIFVSNLDF